jgi:hypothetical protein
MSFSSPSNGSGSVTSYTLTSLTVDQTFSSLSNGSGSVTTRRLPGSASLLLFQFPI